MTQKTSPAPVPSALVLDVDATYRIVPAPTDGHWLPIFYREIDCQLVDRVQFDDEITAWIDDEGLLVGRFENVAGSVLLARHVGVGMAYPLSGAMVVTGGADEEGDTLPLAPEVLTQLVKEAEAMGYARRDGEPAEKTD